ncbi:MAG: MerR family transcriptional regulator [Thermodesulfovibrionales bacterium]|nr:MerR family transcriptional regulator [Thermodesulfovibrionales bacterium]
MKLSNEKTSDVMRGVFKSPQPHKLFPDKLFYKIGEVSKLIGVESYVLRYWETEFPFLVPRKSKSGQRVYTKKDIDLILQIKRLLYEEKYTIDGVRRRLGSNVQHVESKTTIEEKSDPTANAEALLTKVKARLREILHHHFGA